MTDSHTIRINRAPVLTLWAAAVAERLGFDRAAALTLGRAVAGTSAQMKGRALGIYEPSDEPPTKAAEERREQVEPDTVGIRLLGRIVPAVHTPEGIRALEKDFRPASAAAVERYLVAKFKDDLERARGAMERLAESISPDELNRRGFALYEAFRPAVPSGAQGWGAAGELDLDAIVALADRLQRPS